MANGLMGLEKFSRKEKKNATKLHEIVKLCLDPWVNIELRKRRESWTKQIKAGYRCRDETRGGRLGL